MPSATSPDTPGIPPAADPAVLPAGDSSLLKLLPATPKEAREALLLNSQMWSGPLTPLDYLRREAHLGNQDLARAGGLTIFVLVDSSQPENERDILAACETLRKRALVVEGESEVQDVISHGIGSVFCRSEYRGRGYAQRMIQELRGVLEKWQQQPGENAKFNVLFSDIGKKFYAKEGWLPFPSSHVSLPPLPISQTSVDAPAVSPVYAKDIAELCSADERMLRAGLARFGQQSKKTRVALLPDVNVMRWHHAREDFLAQELFNRSPTIKGVHVSTSAEARTWAIWTRTFHRKTDENTLHILRIVIEDEDCYMELHEEADKSEDESPNGAASSNGHADHQPVNNGHSYSNGNSHSSCATPATNHMRTGSYETRIQHIRAVAACLRAAQVEAAAWGMARVDIWNPSSTVLAAAHSVHADVRVVHRDTESIASLLWYGPKRFEDVEWVCNEKYGWC